LIINFLSDNVIEDDKYVKLLWLKNIFDTTPNENDKLFQVNRSLNIGNNLKRIKYTNVTEKFEVYKE